MHCSRLNGSPQKDVSLYYLLETVNVNLFGKRVFADVIKDLDRKRSSGIIRVWPQSSIVFLRDTQRRAADRRGGGSETSEAGGPGAANLRETRGRVSRGPSKGEGPAAPWFQASGLQNYWRINFYCFMLPSLWQFVQAASGN